ncbi:MAG TPA: type II toxin-antitoxin system RelE/ParE family toxin [Pseudolabrys sp.]|nr:type II toxin-antitoxin system RelE/ParE family toxin [Pseudolabrys sp.]
MTLRFVPRARTHLRSIAQYIRQHNPAAARSVRKRIQDTLAVLEQFPNVGHQGFEPGTREVVVPQLPYVIVHTVDAAGAVTVIGVYHAAQLRPGQAEPDVLGDNG